MRHPLLLAALLLLATAAPAAAQNVPKRLDFQGFLSDANGAPAEGEWIVTFRLFGAEDGQLPFFEETITVEPVTGVFGVTLGAAPGNPLPTEPFEDGSVWAAFVVSGGAGPVELAPRLRITSAPYALHAGKAASAGQADNALSLGGVGAGSYVTLSQLPELCVTGEGLPGLLEDLGYTPGAAYTDADVLAFLQDGGYEPCACYGDPEVQLYLDLMGYTPGGSYGDPEVQAFLDLHGYVPGPHYTDADVQDWLDLMGYTAGSGYSDADVQAYLDLLGYTPGAGYTDQDVLDLLDDQGWPLPEDVLLVDGSRDLAGDWDVAKHQLLNLVVHNASAAQPPAAPAAGQLWFDTTAGALRFYTGNAWVSVGTGTVAGDLSCGGCVDAADVSFSWAQGDAPGGAALSAKSLACTGCVVPSHLTVPYAGSATKGGPAGDLDCPACVS
ncbi:MAG: hypothetical protein FJ098_15945, partial [Deltaproteobacteria bacterium]|nr:hypothetical protein [Deltaproteobacteria bacterium]